MAIFQGLSCRRLLGLAWVGFLLLSGSHASANVDQPHLNLARGEFVVARFSPDGLHLLTASRHIAQLWDVKTGREVRRFVGHLGPIRTIAFSPDGELALTAGGKMATQWGHVRDTTARLWEIASGKEIRHFDRQGSGARIQHAAFSRDGKWILTLVSGAVWVWNVDTGVWWRGFSVAGGCGGRAGFLIPAVFSPDSRALAVVEQDRLPSNARRDTLRLWNVEYGAALCGCTSHSESISHVSFSPGGKMVLTASYDGTARTWNAQTGQPIQVFAGHRDIVSSAVFNGDGTRILTASTDETVRLWDAEGGSAIKRYKHRGPVDFAMLVAEDRRILSQWQTRPLSNRKTYVSLWDVETGREIMQTQIGGVLAVTPDGDKILTNSEPTTLWDAATGKPIRRYLGAQPSPKPDAQALSLGSGRLTNACFAPDGRGLLTASDRVAQLWDLETGRQIRRFAGHTGPIRIATFSPDGKWLLTGAGSGTDPEGVSNDQTVQLWDAATGDEIRRFEGHRDFVRTANISPDGRRIFTVSSSHTGRLWNVDSGDELLPDDPVAQRGFGVGQSFSPDGRGMLARSWGANSDRVLLWDVGTRRFRHDLRGHGGDVYSAVFSPDGKSVLTGSVDGTARIWDVKTGRQVRVLPEGADAVKRETRDFEGQRIPLPKADDFPRAAVIRAAFGGNGRVVLTVSADNTVRVWDSDTGEETQCLQHPEGGPIVDAAISADAHRVLTKWRSRDLQDPAIRVSLWDVQTGQEIRQMKLRANSDIAIFSPDGTRVLTTSRHTTLWQAEKGTMVRQYE